jgi:SulP family sulfate permease
MRGYRVSWLAADALAGLTLVAVALPSQMATARLANLPAVDGLYAFIAGAMLYAIIGTDRSLSVGADSTIAPVLAAGVVSVAAVGTVEYSTVMAFAALLIGAMLVVAGLLHLGWIAEFLSTPVITGLLAGIAVEIVVRQLPIILGVTGGGTTTIGRVRRLADEVGHPNGWSLGIAVGVLVLIVGAELIDQRIPGALIALVLSIVVVDVFGLASHHGVTILGAVHGGLPPVGLPSASWHQLQKLIGPVLTVAFVCVAQTAATLRGSAAGAPATDDFNRDLIAVGAGSLAAGLFGTLAVDASPPNTTIVMSSGGRSQVTNVLASAGVLVIVLVATAPLAHLPQATLGATLVFVAAKLFRLDRLRAVLRFARLEFLLAAVTLLVVALIGIEQGVLVAIVLSLADRIRRSTRPQDAVLGREPGTDHWIPVDIGYQTEQIPGVLVYLVYAPLWYANADYLRLRIRNLVSAAAEPVHALIIDADGISDIDYTGLQALGDLISELEHTGVSIGIARASHLVHHDLKHGALLPHLGQDHLFVSVAEAVRALTEPKDSNRPGDP